MTKIFIATVATIIMNVYQNEEIINEFNGCDGHNVSLNSILFDANGYMATTSCHSLTNKLYIFSPNGSYPYYIGFHSKGRFIQISSQQISIYN